MGKILVCPKCRNTKNAQGYGYLSFGSKHMGIIGMLEHIIVDNKDYGNKVYCQNCGYVYSDVEIKEVLNG